MSSYFKNDVDGLQNKSENGCISLSSFQTIVNLMDYTIILKMDAFL